MILTDKQIRDLSKRDKGLLVPFSEDSLQSESYDLSIGNSIAVLKKEVRCIDLRNQNEVDSIYEEYELLNTGYVLSPKEYILVALREKINLTDNITAHIRPRTKFTRLGLLVSDQHCNSTYEGILKIGLFNATDYAIKILPGIKIAQIVFEELKSVPSEDKMYKNKRNAAYQGEEHFIGSKFTDEFQKKVSAAVELLLKKD